MLDVRSRAPALLPTPNQSPPPAPPPAPPAETDPLVLKTMELFGAKVVSVQRKPER